MGVWYKSSVLVLHVEQVLLRLRREAKGAGGEVRGRG